MLLAFQLRTVSDLLGRENIFGAEEDCDHLGDHQLFGDLQLALGDGAYQGSLRRGSDVWGDATLICESPDVGDATLA